MNRQTLSLLAHTDHPIAAPLDDESVHRLLRQAVPAASGASGGPGGPDGGARVLDLGCGQGEWLLRTLAQHPGATAEGVDTSAEALRRARERAEAAGVADRLTLHRTDAAEFAPEHPFDLVLSVGATHAFGGMRGTLATARPHLARGGTVLVGDAYWMTEPSARAREMLGEYRDLASTVDQVMADGWTPVYGHVSTRHELDDYEWCWTGSLSRWALDNPGHPDSGQALEAASGHRDGWLRDYRDSFGFVCLVLRRTVETP